MRLPLRGRHGLSDDIHGRFNRSLTHELLLHFHRRSGLIEPRAVGVPEGMPTDQVYFSRAPESLAAEKQKQELPLKKAKAVRTTGTSSFAY